MAGAGYRNWTPGDIPTATQFDTFLQEQTVMVFASAAARDTALSVPKSEGMVAYLLDVNALTVYSGAAWSTVGIQHGALTSWTPTVTQLGAVSVTNTYSRYQRIGRLIVGWFNVTVTSSGTASNPVLISTPVIAAAIFQPVGAGDVLDASLSSSGACVLETDSTSTFSLRMGFSGDNRIGVVNAPTVPTTLASGDVLRGQFCYEAAADA